MPYLDSKIQPEDHKPSCPKPKAIGLYRRDYDEQGNRTWILRFLECPSCGVVIKLPYKHNPTKKQRDKLMSRPKLPKILNEKENLDLHLEAPKSKEEIEHACFQHTKVIRSKQIKTREIQYVIGPEEKKHRAKIKALNKMYKNDEKHRPRLKGKINWDAKLVERFLDIRPSLYEMWEVVNWPPLYRYNNKKANRNRGRIPDPEKFGYVKSDPDYFTKTPDPNKLGDWEKMVIDEAQGRMEYMESIIRKCHESKIQVYYPVQDEDEKQTEKKSVLNHQKI